LRYNAVAWPVCHENAKSQKGCKTNLLDFIFRALIAFGFLNREPALELPISRPVTEYPAPSAT
jgi:hypothetical protein